MKHKKILDLGCGLRKATGAIGCDMVSLPGVDVVHDLNSFPYPFPDEEFDLVIARHSLQHLDRIVPVMEELHRILRIGGELKIYVPHYASDNFNTDPTHKTHFGYRSMNYFSDNIRFHYSFYSNKRFTINERKMSFRQCDEQISIKNPFRVLGVELLVNKLPRIYERFFAYLLPVSELYYSLTKK
jgi:predicted SAM-dependent methyltransferase